MMSCIFSRLFPIKTTKQWKCCKYDMSFAAVSQADMYPLFLSASRHKHSLLFDRTNLVVLLLIIQDCLEKTVFSFCFVFFANVKDTGK